MAAFHKHGKVFLNQHIPFHLRLKFFDVAISPCALFAIAILPPSTSQPPPKSTPDGVSTETSPNNTKPKPDIPRQREAARGDVKSRSFSGGSGRLVVAEVEMVEVGMEQLD